MKVYESTSMLALRMDIEMRYRCKCRFITTAASSNDAEIVCEFKWLNWFFTYAFNPYELTKNYNLIEGRIITALESAWMHRLFENKT